MDAWFSGFADGEAHFGIVPRNRVYARGGVGYGPIFAVGLRADDLPVLELLHAEFGGSICTKNPSAKASAGINPQVRWTVGSKADLAALVAYFDEFPLRSKKAVEYVLWRRAVSAYAREGYRSEELAALYQPLMEIRRFELTDDPLVVAEPLQLRLVKEA